MLLVLVSAPVESADIKIEVVDPSTGKTISTYEKTDSPAKREQIQEKGDQKRAAEDVPSKSTKKVEPEKRSEGARPENPTNVGEPRSLQQQLEELKKEREDYLYKHGIPSQESQGTRTQSTPSSGATPNPVTNSDAGRVNNSSDVRWSSPSDTLIKGVGVKVVGPLIIAAVGFVWIVVKAFSKVTYSKTIKPLVDSQYVKEVREEIQKDLKAKDAGHQHPG